MILLLNGAFGVGKTSVAKELVRRLRGSVMVDPERTGFVLQRASALLGRDVGDFQDLPLWRSMTIAAIRCWRLAARHVVVPMAFSNSSYLEEIRAGIAQSDSLIHHFCLVAPLDVITFRLAQRGADPVRHSWEYRRAAECCTAHAQPAFAIHVDASRRSIAELADDILGQIEMSSRAGAWSHIRVRP